MCERERILFFFSSFSVGSLFFCRIKLSLMLIAIYVDYWDCILCVTFCLFRWLRSGVDERARIAQKNCVTQKLVHDWKSYELTIALIECAWVCSRQFLQRDFVWWEETYWAETERERERAHYIHSTRRYSIAIHTNNAVTQHSIIQLMIRIPAMSV